MALVMSMLVVADVQDQAPEVASSSLQSEGGLDYGGDDTFDFLPLVPSVSLLEHYNHEVDASVVTDGVGGSEHHVTQASSHLVPSEYYLIMSAIVVIFLDCV